MKLLRVLVLVFVVFAVTALPVFAQDKGKTTEPTAGKAEVPQTIVLAGPGIGAGIGAALTIVGAGYGFGKIGAAALESMARQPEVRGNIQTAMLIIAALLEGATFFSLIVCILLLGRPNV